MKSTLCVMIGGLLLMGCSSSRPGQAEPAASLQAPAISQPALALSFDPQGCPPVPDLARDLRQPAAIGGFIAPSAEYYDIQTDNDFELDTGLSVYQRDVLSDKVGVIFR